MVINTKTGIRDLFFAGIVEKKMYSHLNAKGCYDVEDVLSFSLNPKYKESLHADFEDFVNFLQVITSPSITDEDNSYYNKDLLALLSEPFRFITISIYKIEKKRFNAGIILDLFNPNESDYSILVFILRLFSDLNNVNKEETFNLKYIHKDNGLSDYHKEYVRYRFVITSIIVNIKKSFEAFQDCIYYKRLLDLFDDREINDAELYAYQLNEFIFNVNLIKSEQIRYSFQTNGDIQDKYNELVSSMSVRAQYVMRSNFPDYKDIIPLLNGENKNLRFRNCGVKTANEIKDFLVVFKNYINNKEFNCDANIQTCPNYTFVQINGDIQDKYNELVRAMSVRAQNVMRSNFPDYKDIIPLLNGENKNLRFRNCGVKTANEIKDFLVVFKNYYKRKESILDVDDSIRLKVYDYISFLFELSTKRDSVDNNIYTNLLKIYPTWYDLAIDISNVDQILTKLMLHVPNQAYRCLKMIEDCCTDIFLLLSKHTGLKLFASIFHLANISIKKIIQENRNELEYQERITNEKQILLTELFNKMVSQTSVKCQNTIRLYEIDFKSILSYKEKGESFLLLKKVGRYTATELENLLCKFEEEYTRIIAADDSDVRNSHYLIIYPFLFPKDLELINTFEEKYHHPPMLYILCRYFENTKNYKSQLFASYSGITNNPIHSLDILSERYNLTRERIRQILEKKEFCNDPDFIQLSRRNLWKDYDFSIKSFISISNTNYEMVCKVEQVNLSFFSYCQILSLFGNIGLLNISESGKVLSLSEIGVYQSERKKIFTYAYSQIYQNFSFSSALKEIGRLFRLKRNSDIKIPLNSYFISNSDYWINTNQITEEECNSLLSFFEEIIQTTYGDLVCNGYLVLKANKINIAEILYTIIKEVGCNMHISEIFAKFKEYYPDSKYKEANQIKPFLFKDGRIKNIGRSSIYTLTEWNNYTGSLSELAVMLVYDSVVPVVVSDLIRKMLVYRPDSTERSVQSIISQCVESNRLVYFYGDSVGIPERVYQGNHIIMPRTFDEWLKSFREYVQKNKCFPLHSSRGYEKTLYNWYYDTKSYIHLSSDEILKFHQQMKEFDNIPHTLTEKKFLSNCNAYKCFVKQKKRMIEKNDEESLYCWFYVNLKKYHLYKDNRNDYFKDLLHFLEINLYG